MRAALHAIELEPNLGVAHAALGYALSLDSATWLQAEEEYRKAIALGLAAGRAYRPTPYCNWLSETLRKAVRSF